VEATTASGAMTATMTVPPRSVAAVTAAAGEAEPMDVECCVPPRLCEEDYTREITLAAYHRASRVRFAPVRAKVRRRDVSVARGGGAAARRGRVPRQPQLEHPGGVPGDVLRR
jgi:hypothetical protein